MVTRLERGNRGSILDRSGGSSLLYSVRIGCAHSPASYPGVPEDLSSRFKRPEAEADHSHQTTAGRRFKDSWSRLRVMQQLPNRAEEISTVVTSLFQMQMQPGPLSQWNSTPNKTYNWQRDWLQANAISRLYKIVTNAFDKCVQWFLFSYYRTLGCDVLQSRKEDNQVRIIITRCHRSDQSSGDDLRFVFGRSSVRISFGTPTILSFSWFSSVAPERCWVNSTLIRP